MVPEAHFEGQNVWVLKATGYNRGVGIHVFNKVEHLHKLLQEYAQETRTPQLNRCINLCANYISGKTQASDEGSDLEEAPDATPQQQHRSANFVIQKYLEKPLLVGNRKFDIRVWVLVTHSCQVFVFKEGYIRTSSTEFTLSKDSI